VAQWKASLEGGAFCEKVLYARKLTCHRDASRRELLEDSAPLPSSPGRLFLSGAGSVVHMLDLALQKVLGPAVPPPPPPLMPPLAVDLLVPPPPAVFLFTASRSAAAIVALIAASTAPIATRMRGAATNVSGERLLNMPEKLIPLGSRLERSFAIQD